MYSKCNKNDSSLDTKNIIKEILGNDNGITLLKSQERTET